MCDVDDEAVVAAVDAPSIYDIPKVLHSEGLDAYVVRRLGLPFRDVDWTDWDDLLRRVHHPAHEVTIALVGKYIDLPDAYLSVSEALRAGGFANDARVNLRWVTSDDCATTDDAARQLSGVDAVCVPGGFGVRGIEGKLGALRHAREHQIPTLGLCLGLQCMVIEFARHVVGLTDANSMEFDDSTPYPVIATMADQRDVVAGERDMGGTMRLGLYPAKLADDSIVREVYGEPYVEERHRHRFEVNNDYRDRLEAAGLRISGTSPDGRLVEFVELPREVHPYYVATQAHPEFRSRPTRAHPLFAGLVAAALARKPEQVELPDVAAALTAEETAPTARHRVSEDSGAPEHTPLTDEQQPRPVRERRQRVEGAKWDVVTDRVELDADTVVDRDVVLHPGAVGIVAIDDADHVVMVRQYRHPVASLLWEIPAGLLDDPGESPWQTAVRELVEEAGLRAERWDTVVDLYSSPGMSSETASRVPGTGSVRGVPGRASGADGRGAGHGRHPGCARFLVEQIGRGQLHNALAVAGHPGDRAGATSRLAGSSSAGRPLART